MKFGESNPYVRYVRYLRLNPASRYSPYLGYDARLFYVYDGGGEIEVDGTLFTLKKGDAVLIHSGVPYFLKTPEKHITYLAVNFDFSSRFSNLKTPLPPDTRCDFMKENILEDIRFDDVPEFNRFVYIKDMQRIEPKLISAEREYVRKMIYYEDKLSHLFSQVLIDVVRTLRSRPSAAVRASSDRILDFIHENYASHLTNAYIGQEFGFHPNYIGNLIKRSCGMPLHRYIMEIRLTHAIEYLDSGVLTVSEIAEKCGFCDIYHFSKFFKERIGISPGTYQRSK